MLPDDVKDDVMLAVYKVTRFNIRPALTLMKTLDWSVETLDVNAIIVWRLHSLNKISVAVNMLGVLYSSGFCWAVGFVDLFGLLCS